jgi:hypothetical protein
MAMSSSHHLVAEVVRDLDDEREGGLKVWRDAEGRYHVEEDGVMVQPNHDAEAVIRYLAHCLQNHWMKPPSIALASAASAD